MTALPSVSTDVLIVGGGPVGLCLAYQLQRFSHPPSTTPRLSSPPPAIAVHVVEKYPKPQQEAFGRAVTFWPRSMEILDQLGLADDILQQCVSVRTSAAYDRDGNEVFGRGWSFLEGIEDTRFRFASVLRQKYVEDILRARLWGEFGVGVDEGCGFVGCVVDEGVPLGETGRVVATIRKEETGEEYEVKCKYVIGCDGSRTVVRGAVGIESDGDRTEDKWVRIDGVLKSTTHPKPRAYGAIESPVYGNVLWIPLDHGATRIGFALNEERRKLYGELNRDVFVAEAKLSVKPFEIEYERVDWASVYSVGQRVARNFWAKGCVFLAGDACHTHSSGAGQGMNAGMHDASNLGWKLALVLRGLAKHDLLATYEEERRPNAQKLIKYDEDISVLVTGRLPKSWKGDPNEDPHTVLGKILAEAKGFNTGLAIGYTPGLAVQRFDPVEGISNTSATIAAAVPGFRAPDIKLLSPALWEPVWLQKLIPNVAQFCLLVFVGDITQNRIHFTDLKDQISKIGFISQPMVSKSQTSNGVNGTSSPRTFPLNFITILPSKAANAWHELGTDPLGRVYYDDDDMTGHSRYGVSPEKGGIFVIRPDGWIGARFDMLQNTASVVDQISIYLDGMML